MARIVYRNQARVVPDGELNGDQLLNELQVPPEHDLVLMRPEGNMLVDRQRKVRPKDGDYFIDAPMFEYGLGPPR